MFFNRDISWIQFNSRVLHQALDCRVPLIERVKFLQIFTTNLDEFFMKRVGGLKRQVELGIFKCGEGQSEPKDLLHEIRQLVLPLLKKRVECWTNDLLPEFRHEGIYILEWNELLDSDQSFLKSFFDKNLFPVLTPLSVGPGHPFPFLSNLSCSLGILLRDSRPMYEPELLEPLFARVKIPSSFPQWIRLNPLPGSSSRELRFVSLRQVVSHFITHLFPGMEISDVVPFRITRNADIERDEEDAEDLLEMIAEELRQRRFAKIVRLELGSCSNPILCEFLKTELQLGEEEIYDDPLGIDFSQLSPILEINRRDLKYSPWTPAVPVGFQDREKSIFDFVRESDVLVHHPYESFTHTVEKFIQTAVEDPKVLAIKMTLYRTGKDSPFVPLLIHAAEIGKQVVCLVELKARFDEERNIQLARLLEEAGVHVVYGIVGLKTHCKIALVVRQEQDQVRSYDHISTGNYHTVTSSVYADFGLFTARSEVVDDIVQLFHFLTGRSRNRDYKKLLVAPIQMKEGFLHLIHHEAENALKGIPARIVVKVNSLEDTEIIRSLYEASKAGVQIDLIVRGFCCLVPQVPGLSENIRVISVIGRFLEHCRIFYFQNGSAFAFGGTFLIGSADWMSRNLNRRVEAVVPVEDNALKGRLYEFLQVLLGDHRLAWELDRHGIYHQRNPKPGTSHEGTHEFEMKLYENYRQWPNETIPLNH